LNKLTKILIGGGGTGGHIFPAIAIANRFKEILSDVDILFVGATDRMEMERVPAAGYSIKGLWISGLQRSLSLKNLLFPFKLLYSLLKVGAIIRAFKPNLVIGVGGYSSGPVVYMASRKKIPTLIQEQNSYAGITNKLLAKRVDKICVAYDNMERFFPKDKMVLTGNPVRKDILDISQKKPEALKHFKLSSDKPVILVIGGSLGARTINESIINNIEKLVKSDVQVLWQSGKSFDANAHKSTLEKYAAIHLQPFINKMDLAYAAADIIISRAGAISVSELCIIGKPLILVPSPNVAEDHQTKNAMALVDKQAAILVKDIDAKEKLIDEAIRLINDKNLQHNLSEAIVKLAKKDAAKEIVEEALKLIA